MNIEVIRTDRLKLADTYAERLSADARLLTMAASDEREAGIDRFVVRYFFATGSDRITVLEAELPEADPGYSSLAARLPAAAWCEREAFDLLGVRPIGHPDPRPLVLHDDFPEGVYSLRKDFPLERWEPRQPGRSFAFPLVEGEGVFEVPVGPIHAGIIEPGHFRFQVMGDSVLHLEARLFYTHRGLEKRAEGMAIPDGARLADRICGVCSVSHALSYAQAVEQIAGAEVPERALYLRTLLAEMERLYNHVGDLGNLCAGIGFAYGSNHLARMKEGLMQLNHRIVGHRYLRGTIVPGGLARDMNDAALREILRATQDVKYRTQQFVSEILANQIALDRFRGTGVLKRDVAASFAAVGPAARASGIDADARRDFPHAAYGRLRFEVPVLEDGDVLARLLIRALEVKQAAGLVEQVVEGLPDGAIRSEIGDLPAYRYGIGIAESPRGENVHFVMTGSGNTIFRYRIRSAAYANWPVVASCVPGNIVPDFPLINKSFELCYACCDR